MRYNILWVDDEWEKFSEAQETLENNGMTLIPFYTRKDGMKELEENLYDYHAVLLDANMKDYNEEEVASLTGLSKCIAKINELKTKRALPFYIFTGQECLMNDNTFNALYGKKIYYKYDPDSVDKLISDMKTELDSLPEIQIRTNYNDVFQAICDIGLPKETEKAFLDILIALHYTNETPNFSPELYYNQLRKVVESIFRTCNHKGIIPPECVPDGKINLNQSSLYLAGKKAEHAGVRYREEGCRIIPSNVENALKKTLDFGNLHSHTSEFDTNDKQNIKSVEIINSKYTIYSLCFELCDVVLWFSEYIKEHPDKKENLKNCRNLNDLRHPLEGQICDPKKDRNGFWHVEDCLIGITFWDGNKRMKLKNICKNTDIKTANEYPYFSKFEIVDARQE